MVGLIREIKMTDSKSRGIKKFNGGDYLLDLNAKLHHIYNVIVPS